MYRLEVFINAYDKADILNYLQEIYEAIRYDKKIFVHDADALSNQYMSATLYEIDDEYDEDKYCESLAMAKPVFNNLERDIEYYRLTHIMGLSDEEAKKEIEERF